MLCLGEEVEHHGRCHGPGELPERARQQGCEVSVYQRRHARRKDFVLDESVLDLRAGEAC